MTYDYDNNKLIMVASKDALGFNMLVLKVFEYFSEDAFVST